jgi:hypothetical protein
MKKFYLFLLLIFIVFSCKGTPKKDQGADDPDLSQLELTAEKDQDEADAGFDNESRSDEDMLAQDGIADGSEIDDVQTDARLEEQPIVVEETPPVAPQITAVTPPAVPVVTAVPLPPAIIEEPQAEQPAQEEQAAAQEESAVEQKTTPRSQPWQAPPPAVTAVKDDAPVPNQRLLVPPKEDEIVFFFLFHATVGQIVEIPFRGTNWSYLEERVSRRGLVYNSRRLDPEGQSFIFMAEEAGTYILKFKKQDFLRDYFLNDYVQVIVSEQLKSGGAGWFNPPADRVRVTAEPRWPSALDEAAMLRGAQAGTRPGASAESSSAQGAGIAPSTAVPPVVVIVPPAQGTGTAPSTAPMATPQTVTPQVSPQITTPEPPQTVTEASAVQKQEKLPPEEMLKKAQDSFNEGNTAAAIALLDQFTEDYPDGSDELYWLYGQFYEANTPHRNIKLSLDYYRRIVNEYPQSRRYNDARRRIAYLERFYINIQ